MKQNSLLNPAGAAGDGRTTSLGSWTKRLSLLMATLAVGFGPLLRGQDAATEERLNKLSGRIDDLMAAQESMRKQISELTREVAGVREQASRPAGNFASEEDVTRLKRAIEEVDRKRVEDADKIHSELLKVRKAVLDNPVPPPPRSKNPPKEKETTSTLDKGAGDKPVGDEKGYPYVVLSGDSLSLIAQAYREKNIKVTVDQILKANPGLNEKKLKVGQKIFIPMPAPPP